MVRVLPAARIIRLYTARETCAVRADAAARRRAHPLAHQQPYIGAIVAMDLMRCWARDFLIQFHRVSPLSNQDSNCVISKWNKKGTSIRLYIQLARPNRILERYLKIYIWSVKRNTYSFAAALSAQYIMPRDEVIDPIDAAVHVWGVCTNKRPIRNDLLPVDIAFIIYLSQRAQLFLLIHTLYYMCVCRVCDGGVWWCTTSSSIHTKDESNELCAKSKQQRETRGAGGGGVLIWKEVPIRYELLLAYPNLHPSLSRASSVQRLAFWSVDVSHIHSQQATYIVSRGFDLYQHKEQQIGTVNSVKTSRLYTCRSI